MRSALIWIVLLAACSERKNPNVCCATEAQCMEVGFDELTPCGVGQACTDENTCVAAECQVNADCDDARPICRLGFCESSCASDDDCNDVTGRPYCLDQACVGCRESTQCPASAAICDADEHTCRGCERDDECASEVCLEAEGICADESRILWVGNGVDSGTCTKAAPCRTIGYAYSLVGLSNRNIVRVTGGMVSADASTVVVNVALVIDGTSTMIAKPASMPWLQVGPAGSVTLEGVTVLGVSNDEAAPSVVVGASAQLLVGPRTVMKGTFRVTAGGAINIDRATVESGVLCVNSTIDVRDSTFSSTTAPTSTIIPQVEAMNCSVNVRRSRFAHHGPTVAANGGTVVVENNLFASTLEYADLVYMRTVQNGSVFRFNTVVNLVQSDTGDGVALDCDQSVDVSSNVFAYRSEHPFGSVPGCLVKYSVIDSVALPLPTPPVDSSYHPFATLFQNPTDGDFRLSPTSPARAASDPTSTVVEDIDGNVRPRPVGTRADAGAFEADQ